MKTYSFLVVMIMRLEKKEILIPLDKKKVPGASPITKI
jgi:hypothetical protein